MRIYPQPFICAMSLALLAACGQQATSEQAASAALSKAKSLVQAGQYQSARGEIESAIKANPRASDAHLLAGQIAEKLGDLQTALSEYVSADATGPDRSEGRHAAAAMLLRARAYNVAQEWIARCIADRPSDKPMKAYRALLEQRLGDIRKARADAESILTENAADAVANAVLAEQALLRTDPAQALVRIEAGLSKEASDRALLQLKAEAFLQQQSPEKAVDIYRALVAADPTSPELRAGLAELVARLSGVDQGEAVFRAGIEAAQNSIDMHMRLVSFLARHRDKSAVVAELVSAMKASPDLTAYDVALAEVYAQDKDFETASRVLRDAIAREPQSPAHLAAQIALARLMLARDDIAAARTIVDAMLQTKPVDDDVVAVRGQLSLKEQNPGAAVQDFLSIAAHQPANAAVYTLLAEAYLQNDQSGEAIAALRRVLSLNPANFEIVRRIVEIESGLGDLAATNRTTEDFVLRNPDSLDGRTLQLRSAIRSKDWTSAQTALVNLPEQAQSEQLAIELEAEISEAQNRYPEAASLYERLIVWKESGPFNIAAAQAFARTSIAAGRSQPGVDGLTRRGSDVSPTDVASYELILATLYDSLGQDDKAQSLTKSAIARAPASPASYLQQAQAFVRKKSYGSALTVLDRGLAAGAPKEPLLLIQAQVENADGRTEAAIATYRELLRMSPRSVVAANELANALADRNPLDKTALRDARDLLQKNATFKSLAITDTLAWSSYRLGDLQTAKQLLAQVKADQLPNPQVRFHYGAILVALGDETKGKKIIKTTLNETYPGLNEAQQMVKDQ